MEAAERTIRNTLGLETAQPQYTAYQKTPWLLYGFTCLASIGGFLFGYDTGIISGAILLVRKDFKLSSIWSEFVVASALGSAALFSLVAGYLNSKIGRKPVILLAAIIFASGSMCMACADDRYMLVIGRMIIGAGIGLVSTTVPMFIAEAAPASIRGRLISVNIVSQAGGQLVANIISGAFTTTKHGWRYMIGLGAIPAVVQFVGFMFMPESARWLIQVNRPAEAKESLLRLRGSSDVIEEEFDSMKENILAEKQEMAAKGDKALIVQIFETPAVVRALIVGCGLQMFQQLAGINTVIYYSSTIIAMAGLRGTREAIWLMALTSAVNFLFTFVGLYLVEKMGRRPLTIISLVGAIVSLAFLGVGFQLENDLSPNITVVEEVFSNCSEYRSCGACNMDVGCGFCYNDLGKQGMANGSCLPAAHNNDWLKSSDGRCDATNSKEIDETLVWAYNFCPTPFYYIPLIGLVMYLIFFAPGMSAMPWTVNAEIYPVWARGAGNGASTFTNWLFNLCISVSFLSLTDTIGPHGTFWMFLGFSLLGLIFLSLTLPETKGKTLEEIEGIFAAPWFSSKCKFNPYTKESTRFNYMHVDPNDNKATGARRKTNRRGQPSADLEESVADSLSSVVKSSSTGGHIETQICTNREVESSSDESFECSDSDFSASPTQGVR